MMDPLDIERFTIYNEAPDGPLHRVLLKFEGATDKQNIAVILLNDDGLVLSQHLQYLVGRKFQEAKWDTPLNAVLQIHGFPEPAFHGLRPEVNQRIDAWNVLARGRDLLVSLQKVPRKSSKAIELPLAIGIVVTGKENISDRRIVSAEMLPKDVPTPFVVDEWGDSYNDSFGLEPRIIESVPQTVFNAVEEIMAVAKRAFSLQNYDVAASKYRKAFHYSHKYYPESLDAEDLDKAADLKKRSLLNLALSGILADTKPWLNSAIEAANFVLEMPEATEIDRAKALNRRGRANLGLGDDETARTDLELSLALRKDASTELALEKCDASRRQRLASLQKRLNTAFR